MPFTSFSTRVNSIKKPLTPDPSPREGECCYFFSAVECHALVAHSQLHEFTVSGSLTKMRSQEPGARSQNECSASPHLQFLKLNALLHPARTGRCRWSMLFFSSSHATPHPQLLKLPSRENASFRTPHLQLLEMFICNRSPHLQFLNLPSSQLPPSSQPFCHDHKSCTPEHTARTGCRSRPLPLLTSDL